MHKCGNESKQLIVQYVKHKKDNERLIKHQQICQKYNYTNFDISIIDNNKEK